MDAFSGHCPHSYAQHFPNRLSGSVGTGRLSGSTTRRSGWRIRMQQRTRAALQPAGAEPRTLGCPRRRDGFQLLCHRLCRVIGSAASSGGSKAAADTPSPVDTVTVTVTASPTPEPTPIVEATATPRAAAVTEVPHVAASPMPQPVASTPAPALFTDPAPVYTPPAPAYAPPPAPQPASAYYPNCPAARAAGVTPICQRQPGYSPHLDRDGDGIACE